MLRGGNAGPCPRYPRAGVCLCAKTTKAAKNGDSKTLCDMAEPQRVLVMRSAQSGGATFPASCDTPALHVIRYEGPC